LRRSVLTEAGSREQWGNVRLAPPTNGPAASMIATTTCLTGISLPWLIACRSRNTRYLAPLRRPSSPSTTLAPDLGRPEIGSRNAPSDRLVSGHRKYRERAAERCVVPQGGR